MGLIPRSERIHIINIEAPLFSLVIYEVLIRLVKLTEEEKDKLLLINL